MIRVGQVLPSGNHPNIRWQCSAIETAELQPSYGLIVAGASLHWMDWEVVLPKFGRHLVPDGYFALVSGDGPIQVAWTDNRRELIADYSTMHNYKSFNMVEELEKQTFCLP